MSVKAYAAMNQGAALVAFDYVTGDLEPWEVEVSVSCCALCHGDLHLIDNTWGISGYPLVPGHEIVGTVTAKGSEVAAFETGQRVGIGLQVGACLDCEWCRRGKETCCPDLRLIGPGCHGGFAERMRADSRFVYPLPDELSDQEAAPLLCAGIAVYAPLRRYVRAPMRVGIIGMGGLGHLALQFARALGCEVTLFSTSAEKAADARRLGADQMVVVGDSKDLEPHAGSQDLILCTVDAALDWAAYLNVLRPEGVLCFVGIPDAISIPGMPLVFGRKTVTSSLLGNRSEFIDMLNLAARRGIKPLVQCLPMAEVNTAVERLRSNRQRYRIVLENVRNGDGQGR